MSPEIKRQKEGHDFHLIIFLTKEFIKKLLDYLGVLKQVQKKILLSLSHKFDVSYVILSNKR